MNHEPQNAGLTSAGIERRAEMRAALLDAFATLHRARRRRRRASAGLALLALFGATAWLAAHLTNPPAPDAAVTRADPQTPPMLVEVVDGPVPPAIVEFALVAAAEGSLVRTIDPGPSIVEVISDDQLVQTLAEMNRPAGLIAVGGRVRLTSPVTDGVGEPPPGDGSRLDHPRVPASAPTAVSADASAA